MSSTNTEKFNNQFCCCPATDDYTTAPANLVSDTTTISVNLPTKEYCEKEIIYCIKEYAKKKWWQEKKFLLNRAKFYADILNNNYN